MKHFLTSCAVFWFLSVCAGAQSPTNINGTSIQPTNAGTDFYFSFPPCLDEESIGLENSCRVFVTSSVKQLITVEVPGKGWKMTKIGAINDAIEFILPTGVAQPFFKRGSSFAPPEQVYQGAAIHVYANAPIIAYGVTRYHYNSEGFLALPVSVLGTEYIVASWPQHTTEGSTYQLVAETTISAAYDETVVQFVMGGTSASTTSGGLKPGQSETFIMHKGDVLCFASNGDGQDISGSRIKSTKPIAVVSGNQCASIPAGDTQCDYLSEMELPTYSWGKEYHVTPIFGRKKNSIVRIFAKEKNTTIYRDSVFWFTLTGSRTVIDSFYAERRASDGAPRAVIITADKPISVVQYNPGKSDDNIASNQFQMALTPFEQYQKEIVFCTPGSKTGNNNFKIHYINLIYQLGAGNTVPEDLEFAVVVNGNFRWRKVRTAFGDTPGMLFSKPVNGAAYACKQFALPGDGVYRIRANSPLAAYSYGFSDSISYGFPASVGLTNLTIQDSAAPIATWTQDCDGAVRDGLVKDYPDSNDLRSNFGLIYMDLHADSSYNYDFKYDKNRTLVSGETREIDWSLNVIAPNLKARAVLWFTDRVGNYTTQVFEYTPSKITLSPNDYLDFGLLKPNQSMTKIMTLTNESPNDMTVFRFELKSGSQGITLQNVPLPFTMKSGEKKDITFTFVNPDNGIYIDTIGIGDECQFVYKTQIKAEIASPVVEVHDYNYGTRIKNSSTHWTQLLVKNAGRVDLIISGDDHLTALQNTPEFQPVNWSHTYPQTLRPGQNLQLQVDYLPTKKGTSTARITFSSDASLKDSVCVLTATAIDTSTVGVESDISPAPFTLGVSPNPIEASGGAVEFTMQSHGFAELTLISSTGERVATLAQSAYDKGNYQVRIPVELLSSGSYTVRMVVGNFSLEKAVVIVK